MPRRTASSRVEHLGTARAFRLVTGTIDACALVALLVARACATLTVSRDAGGVGRAGLVVGAAASFAALHCAAFQQRTSALGVGGATGDACAAGADTGCAVARASASDAAAHAPVKEQCGFGLAQSVSVRHAWQTRKPRPPAKPIWTLPQYGKVAGQSVLAAHWVHVPIAHTLAVETSGMAAGHSAFVSQGRPLPEGASGIGGQAHCPHH